MQTGLPAITSFIAGDVVTLTIAPFAVAADRLISPSGGWTLRLALRGAKVLDAVCAPSASDSAGNWEIVLASSDTGNLVPGPYAWAFTATDASGSRLTANTGSIRVLADLTAAVAGFDPRSQAEIALAQAESALAAFRGSSGRIKQYTIGGRTFIFDTSAELLQVVNYWKVKVATEHRQARAAQGLGDPSLIRVRFK